MNRTVTIHRLARPRFNRYETDGLGRDTYISFNNGGFCVKDAKEIKYRPNYPVYHKINYHSLGHSAAPFRYYSDGTGRDSYVLDHDGGLKHDTKPLSNYHLTDFLRTGDQYIYETPDIKKNSNGVRINTHFMGKNEFIHNQILMENQKRVIKNLYTMPMIKQKQQKLHLKKKYLPYLRIYDNNLDDPLDIGRKNRKFDLWKYDTNYENYEYFNKNKNYKNRTLNTNEIVKTEDQFLPSPTSKIKK